MENENDLNPQQSLALIEGMINKAKNNFSDNSILYLLWGWTVFFCAIGHFLLQYFKVIPHPEMIWMATWAIIVYQIVYLSKQKKKKRVKTYSEEIISYIWICFSVFMLLTIFILSKTNSWLAMYPIFLVMYGVPTFLSGVVMQFRPLRIGGICCWILSVVATFVAFQYVLLLLALAVVAAWIIPGYLLKAKYKNQAV